MTNQKKKINIISASSKEMDQLLNHSKIKFTNTGRNLYASSNADVHITGIGKHAVEEWLKKSDTDLFRDTVIIKAGACAVIGDKLELFKPLIPSNLIYKDMKIQIDIKTICPEIYNEIKELVTAKAAATLDKPLCGKDEREILLRNNIAFCDMETYFIAEKFKGYEFFPLLTGTDRGDKNAVNDFFKNLAKASLSLKEILEKIILK